MVKARLIKAGVFPTPAATQPPSEPQIVDTIQTWVKQFRSAKADRTHSDIHRLGDVHANHKDEDMTEEIKKTKRCSVCGKEYAEKDKYCREDGSPLQRMQPPAAEAMPVNPARSPRQP